MVRRTDTKDRMIATAATLLQRQGYAATGWRQVVAESGTPWGSQSHHFPGGKEELAVAALSTAGADYGRLIRRSFATGHPADAIRTWAELAADVLEATGWADGCPIATVALERAHDDDAIGSACRTALLGWRDAIEDGLVAAGAAPSRSRSLATLVLAAIEGALLLARVERRRDPLLVVGDEMAALLATAVPR